MTDRTDLTKNCCEGCGKSFATWVELEAHRKVCEA